MKRFLFTSAVIAFISSPFLKAEDIHKGNWIQWRGPLQSGVSLESYKGSGELDPEPVWTDEISGRGTPVIYKGRMYTWGYRGKGPDLEEVLQARDEKTGKVLWEKATHDFISDTIYNRYSIGAPAIDPETENVIVATTYGLVTCYSKDGDKVWEHSMIERFGRLTFPNGRAGAPVIDGDIAIIRGVTSYWGADGPARDRFFGFNKNTGELLWSSTPGVGPPYLKDSSMSTPYVETRDGKRVFYAGTGCGNIVCVNVNDGTPLWRYQISKGGVNSSPLIHGDNLICIHGKENLDTTEIGRAFAIKLPGDFDNTGGVVDPEQKGAPRINDIEVWRNRLEMFTSSPTMVGDKVFQLVKTGSLYCLDANSGKTLWELKLANEQLHASPTYADGKLYVTMFPGDFYVIDVSGDEGKIAQKMHFEDENCIGSPAVCNGMVYVHTTEKLYAFKIKNDGITYADAPKVDMPAAGPAAKLSAVPTDVLLKAGDSADLKIHTVDANGIPVGDASDVSFAKFIPPTAKVKAEMDASFSGTTISAANDAKLSAGAWKATSGDLSGILRGRVISNLPYNEDFEGFDLVAENQDGKFAYPPLPWIGARLKWEIRELDGNKVLAKTLDRVLFQRSLSFIGDPELSSYTLQADMMTDGNRRVKSVVGLINQRYIIALIGNANALEISSNHERVKHSVPFRISANKWYTLKTRVDTNPDGSGVVRGKAWVKGEPEPDSWTVEFTHKNVHKKGAPGLFGFSPQSQKSVFIDNISITQN